MSTSTTQTAAKSQSLSTFTTALVTYGAVFVIELVIFTIVRKRFKSIYEPRTFIPKEEKRMRPLPTGLLSWPLAVFKADYNQVKHQNGMDAYMFLRYLRMMVRIFVPIWALSWAVLLPLTSVKSDGGKTQLERFTFGNISSHQKSRYAGYVILSWLFTGYIVYNIQKEMRQFVAIRQKFLVSPAHSATAQANTVLITGIPLRYLSEHALTRLFAHLPGGVAKVWVNHDLKDMPDLYEARLKACNKLESAELALIKTAGKLRKSKKTPATQSAEHLEDGDKSLAHSLVPREKRPSHRLPAGFLPFALPFIGKKVDSIDWATEEIVRTTQALDKQRAVLETEEHADPSSEDLEYPPLNSAFVYFNTQIAAHMAAQVLTHHAPYRMSNRYTEVAPADVIWENLNMNPYEMKIRTAISYVITAVLIIFWVVPVTFVGGVSNIVATSCNTAWLSFLCGIPPVVSGLLQGVLPAVLLAVLNLLLPIILRLLARFEGIPRKTGLELSLMTRFFIFQVLNNFIVLTIAGTLATTAQQIINNPTSATSTLAQGIPTASTFFLTYVLLQGLAGSAAGFLQIVALVVYYAKLFILGSTPRSIYSIQYDLRDVAWGTLFPAITLITVISFAYMLISPIMSALACAAFFLLYMMWKYLFLWQLDQPASGDTGGLFFPKAIQHTMVGLYIQQVVLAILLFLAKAIPEGAVIVVLIVLTVLAHIVINNSFNPLLYSLPLTFANRSYGMQTEEDDQLSIDEDDAEGFGGEQPTADKTAARRRNTHKAYPDDNIAVHEKNGAPRATMNTGDIGEASNAYGDAVATEGKRNDGPTDFNHPACVEPQRVIWIPQDEMGLAEDQIRRLTEVGIVASSENATINAKGKTEIQGHPPGMDNVW